MTDINQTCLKSKNPLAVIGENATLVHFEDLHCQEGKESREETQCHSGEPGETDMLMTPGHEVNSNSWDLSSDQPVPASFSVFSQSLDNPNAVSGHSSGMSPNGKCKSADVPKIHNPVSAGDDVKSLMQGLRDEEVNPVVSHPLGANLGFIGKCSQIIFFRMEEQWRDALREMQRHTSYTGAAVRDMRLELLDVRKLALRDNDSAPKLSHGGKASK